MADPTPSSARPADAGDAPDAVGAAGTAGTAGTAERFDRFADVFGDDPGPRRRLARWTPLAVLGVAAIVGTVLVVADRAAGGTNGLRTATAGTHDVDRQWAGVGTIEPVSQAVVAFPVAGTVATVTVEVGDRVSVGTTLATLDTASLQASLHTRQAELASARLALTAALTASETAASSSSSSASSSSASSSSSGAAGSGGSSGAGGTGSGSGGGSGATPSSVVDAQQAADAALAAVDAALASADAVCSAADATTMTAPSTTTTTPSTTAPASTTTSPSTTTPSTTTPVADTSVTACRRALDAAAAAQRTSAAKEQALVAALRAWTASNAATSNEAGTGAAARAAATGSSATGSSATGSGAPGSSATGAAGRTPSAEDLVADQRTVDAAFWQVAAATQAVGQATLLSPIDGTVVAVTIGAGDTVTAASSTATITIAGAGGYEVAARVPVDDMARLATGQAAEVVPDGTDRPLAGQVVAIAAVPTEGTTGTTYLVTIGLHRPDVDLPNGSTGTLTITTAAADAALAVPSSAVTTDGTRHTVKVVDASRSSGYRTASVGIGVVGARWTEIRSGLRSGDKVVLADLGAPLPGSATDTSGSGNGATGGGGTGPGAVVFGPGGGNFPGGAPPGGGPPGN